MNACAIKPMFVTTKALKRTPATKQNIDMVRYMDSHEFFLHVDKDTGEIECGVNATNRCLLSEDK